MRLTLDTNVLIAAFISRGTSDELFEHVVRHHTLVLSPFIVGEFRRILRDKFGMPQEEVAQAIALLRESAQTVAPEPLPEPVWYVGMLTTTTCWRRPGQASAPAS